MPIATPSPELIVPGSTIAITGLNCFQVKDCFNQKITVFLREDFMLNRRRVTVGRGNEIRFVEQSHLIIISRQSDVFNRVVFPAIRRVSIRDERFTVDSIPCQC